MKNVTSYFLMGTGSYRLKNLKFRLVKNYLKFRDIKTY